MAVAFRAGANNKANSAAPSVVVPAGCVAGDVIVVHISQNNTNVITATPGGLTTQNTNTTTASFPNILYTGVVGVGGITAGGTLSWTLSATRQWSVVLYAASGVDNTTPILGTISTTANATAASTAATPSLTTAASAWILELLSGKSNGTAITGWTPPAGWTVQQSVTAAGTFAGGASVADRNAGTAAAGTYGTDTYTASSGFAGLVTYTFALNPANTVTPITLTDTGAGADALTAASAAPLPETGLGTDAITASVALALADTATGTDTLAVSIPKSLSETGTGTDAQAVTAAVPLAQTGVGADGLGVGVTLTISETAHGTDALTVVQAGSNPSLPDLASGLDSLVTSIHLSLSDLVVATDSLAVVKPADQKYLFSPPQWRNVQGPPERSLRYGFPTSTCVYRTGGVWHNTMVSGPDDPYATADVDPTTGQKLFFVTPTVVSGAMHDEIAAQALTPSNPLWSPGTLTLVV